MAENNRTPALPGAVPPPPSGPRPGPAEEPAPRPNDPPQAEYGRGDLLTGRNPAWPGGRFTVDPGLLQPAALKAAEIGGELRRLGGDVGQPAPAGCPGFASAVQLGVLNAAWGGEIAGVADAARAAGDKITHTRQAFLATEAHNAGAFRPGA